MIRKTLAAMMLFSLLLVVPVASAQRVDAPAATTDPSSGSVRQAVAVQAGISREAIERHTLQSEALPATSTATLQQSRVRRGRTLMIVGGAAFLAGLIIGDDAGTAIAVGGAAIGLYGLYQWAQTQ